MAKNWKRWECEWVNRQGRVKVYTINSLWIKNRAQVASQVRGRFEDCIRINRVTVTELED